jgi:hypothetical protein
MKIRHGKYILTQLSGVIFALISVFILVLIINEMRPSLLGLSDFMSATIFFILFFLILIGSLVLWGKILVFMGLLTKEEAKGYPYSKPWDNNKLI